MGPPFLLENALCPLCGIEPTRIVRTAESWLDDVPGEFGIRSCPSCGLWITSPRPRKDDLWRVYPAQYHRVRIAPPAAEPVRASKGTLLDVGCGVGDGLVLARQEGWECYGVEVSDAAAAVARQRGFVVTVGDAIEVGYPDIAFDRVNCWHTLEHVHDPVSLLGRLREAVSPTGSISLIVPNRQSATSIAFRRYWLHLDLPRHLYHFRPQDVTALARYAGLDVRFVRHTASPSGFFGSIDCVAAGLAWPNATKLRSRTTLRALGRFAAWPFARLGFGDIVEYGLVHMETA